MNLLSLSLPCRPQSLASRLYQRRYAVTLSPLNKVTSHSTFIGFLCGGLVDRSTDSSGVRTVFSAGVLADVVTAGAGPGAGAGAGAGPAFLDVLRFDISDKKKKEASKKIK